MIVSTATAVLPVCRSPMISSRWPRPIGIIESIDLEPGLHRLVDALALHDAGGLELHRAGLGGVERALAVDGLAQRVDHPADERIADGHAHDLSGALGLVALLDELVVPQESDTHVAFLEVEDHAADVVGKLEQLARHRVGEPVDAGDAVTDREHGARLLHGQAGVVPLDLLSDDAADFVGSDFHG